MSENFSVYNLIMSVINFEKCNSSQDAVREFYRGVYPYLRQQLIIIKTMEKVLKDNDLLEDERLDVFRGSLDIFSAAEKRLNSEKDSNIRSRKMDVEITKELKSKLQSK